MKSVYNVSPYSSFCPSFFSVAVKTALLWSKQCLDWFPQHKIKAFAIVSVQLWDRYLYFFTKNSHWKILTCISCQNMTKAHKDIVKIGLPNLKLVNLILLLYFSGFDIKTSCFEISSLYQLEIFSVSSICISIISVF